MPPTSHGHASDFTWSCVRLRTVMTACAPGQPKNENGRDGQDHRGRRGLACRLFGRLGRLGLARARFRAACGSRNQALQAWLASQS